MTVQTIEAYSEAKAKGSWRWLIAAGVLFIIAAIVAALQPFMPNWSYRLILSLSLVIGGVIGVAAGYASQRDEGAWLYMLIGISGLLGGAILGLMNVSQYLTLVWAVSGWLIIAGAAEMTASITTLSDRAPIGVLGLMDMGMGLVLLTLGAQRGLELAPAFVAISFFLRGAETISFGLKLRRERIR